MLRDAPVFETPPCMISVKNNEIEMKCSYKASSLTNCFNFFIYIKFFSRLHNFFKVLSQDTSTQVCFMQISCEMQFDSNEAAFPKYFSLKVEAFE